MAITLPTVSKLFNAELTFEEKNVAGAKQAGMIRTMADFAKGAYNLNHPNATEYVVINDDSPHATEAFNEVIGNGWTPVNFTSLTPILDRGAIQSGMLTDGFYINGNASACVERCGDAIVLSFRGTNDNSKDGVVNSYDPNNTVHQDKDQWTQMQNHYALLQPLISAFDAYVTSNGISKVYVTGHSMGGSMAIEYMSHHSGSQYQAVTFGASPFGQPYINFFGFTMGTERKDYSADSRITEVEILKDPVPMAFDIRNLWGNTNFRPGHVIDFGGNKTMDTPNLEEVPWVSDYYAREANHSMDYYRQITDSVDADSWTKILAGAGKQTVLLGGQQISGASNFVVDGQLSGNNNHFSSGNDTLLADAASSNYNVFYGGKGNDTITGGDANELMLGGIGKDTLNGNGGADRLFGGSDIDYLFGGKGADRLVSGLGNDKLTGGAGADKFVFDTRLNTDTNVDFINDFNVIDDTLWFDRSVFSKFSSAGSLPARMLSRGAVAVDKDDFFSYNKSNGELFYDVDGSGVKTAIEIAILGAKTHPDLSASDFLIV